MKKKLKLKNWVKDAICATIVTTMFVVIGIIAFKIYGLI